MLCCFKKEYVHRYVLHLYEYVIKKIWTILKTIYVNYIYIYAAYVWRSLYFSMSNRSTIPKGCTSCLLFATRHDLEPKSQGCVGQSHVIVIEIPIL